MESRDPIETRAPGETAPNDLDVEEAVAAFSSPLRHVGPVSPAKLLVCSGGVCFAGTTLGLAVGSAVPAFAATCLGLVGSALAAVQTVGQLLRHSRGKPRDSDHSIVLLLFLVPVGLVWLVAMGFWVLLLCCGNPAD